MSRYALALCATLAFGCGNEYRCPDPIGKIVRDDCEAYKVKYDQLKVELGFSIGGVGFGVKAGKEKLRDPSELLQVLMMGTMALCKDYNACRVPSGDYRRRRELADRKFTAVVAISQQLKGALDKESKRKLVAKLIEVITEKPGRQRQLRGRRSRGLFWRRPIAYHPGMFRRVSRPWFGSKFMPDRPKLPDGLPVLASWWVGHGSGASKSTHFAFTFWGKTEADDRLTIRLVGGESYSMAVKPQRHKLLGKARLHVPGKHVGGSGVMIVAYKKGATGKTHTVGTFKLDPAIWLDRGYLAYHADPIRKDPVEYERPYLVFYSKVRKRPRVTLRCKHEGKRINAVLDGRSRYNPYRASKLRIHTIALPVRIGVKGGRDRLTWRRTIPGEAPLKDMLPAEAAGRWTCTAKLNARKARVFEFSLRRDGSVVPTRKPDDGAWPWWPITTKRIPNEVEAKAH